MQQQPGSGRGRQRPAGGGAEAAMPPYHHYYGSMEDDDKADGDWKQRGARAGGQLPNPQPPPPQQQQVGRRQRRKRGSSSWDRAEVVRGVLFGAINASICLPASVSFATIIFRHEAFVPYLPDLVRLVLLSSAVHAAAFVALSSMPFAVGQVQDAGLIFLSTMASTVADHCRSRNLPDDVLLSTALVIIALATATLGLALIGIGRLGLASIVQYLPMAAVGGYLGFLGFFMGKAGLAFMTATQLDSWDAWWGMVSDPVSLAKLAPGLGLGVGIFLLARRVQHMLTLPGCMALAVALFYAALWAGGYTLDDARTRLGWVAPSLPARPFWEAWALFDFRAVQWDVIPSVLPTWLALVIVVAFSSSLDVAAIEMEVRRPLDYAHELQMIGVSNVLSGLSGGYTGSYIFSQTIFCLRNGIRSRTCSAVIALLELGAFLSPVSILSFVPRFFFGGLLVLIALDLMLEWLWHSRQKMMGAEYWVALATFLAIGLTNIELGMTIGVLLAMLAFTLSYAEAPLKLAPRVRHSTVVRTFEERSILATNQDKVVYISLRGWIFFGSAVRVLRAVKETVLQGHMDARGRAFSLASLDEEDEDDGEDEGEEEDESLLLAAVSREPSDAQPAVAMAASATTNNNLAAPALTSPPGNPYARSNPRTVPAPFASLATGAAASAAASAAAGALTSASAGAVGRQSSAGSSVSSASHAFRQQAQHRRPRSRRNSEDMPQPGSVRASSLMTPVYNRGGVWVEVGGNERAASAEGTGAGGGGGRDEEMGVGGGCGGASSDEEDEEDEEEEEELEELLGAMDVGEAHLPLMTRSRSSRSRRSDASSNMNSIASFETAAEGEFFDAANSPPRSLSPMPLAVELLRQRRPHSAAAAGGSRRAITPFADQQQQQSQSQRQPSPLRPSPERLRWEGQEEQQRGGLLERYLQEWATATGGNALLPSSASAPAGANRIRHLVFDFEHVIGIDATAARACFLMLKSLLRTAGVKVHFAAASLPVARLLRGHGVVGEGEKLYVSLDEALEACEEALLRSAAELSREDLLGLSRHPSFYAAARRSRHLSHRALRDPNGSRRDRLVEAEEALDLESILADYLEVRLPAPENGGGGAGEEEEGGVGRVLGRFFVEREFHAGQALFRAGEASDHLFFLRKGVVELQVPPAAAPTEAAAAAGAAAGGSSTKPQRLMKISDGGSVGELGFFLKRPQAFSAVATTRCLVYALSRPNLLALARAQPQLCCLLQQAVIKSLSLASSYAIADFNESVSTALLTHRPAADGGGGGGGGGLAAPLVHAASAGARD